MIKYHKGIMMKKIVLISLTIISIVYAKDAKGSKDHSLFNRYPGFYIKGYKQLEYDEAKVIIGVYDRHKNEAGLKTVEGKVTNITYKNLPQTTDTSVFQMYKNFENALKKQDASILFSCRNESCVPKGENSVHGVHLGNWIRNKRGLFKGLFGDVKKEFGIITAEIPQKDGLPIVVSFVMSEATGSDRYILETVIEPKALDNEKIGIGSVSDVEKKMDKEGKVSLEGIYFDFDKATIKPESKETLDVISQYLKKHKAQNFYIVGHTDNKGTYKHNMQLSNHRAKAVEKYLKSISNIPNKLQSVGIGSISPIASNGSEEGRKKNRRVELVLMR